MKQWISLALLALFSLTAVAKTHEGQLIGGGGIDDLSLMIKTKQGKTVDGYCKTVSVCNDWDVLFISDKDGVYSLKPSYKGKSDAITVILPVLLMMRFCRSLPNLNFSTNVLS